MTFMRVLSHFNFNSPLSFIGTEAQVISIAIGFKIGFVSHHAFTRGF